VFHRINQHLQIHNILSEDQFGFRKGLPTINALYKINESVLMSWEKKMHVGGIFCDVAKESDCVNHETLL
jgi:hypothetical protein